MRNRLIIMLPAAALAVTFVAACSEIATDPELIGPDSDLRYTSEAGVDPVHIPDATNTNKTCGVLIPGSIELKEDAFTVSGSLNDGTLFVTWTKPSTLAPGNPNTFDWSATGATVLGVVVKDGVDGANFYDYRPGGSTGDRKLSTPFEGDKAISHVSWCYTPDVFTPRGEVTVEKTAETSFTREHSWDIAKRVETENEHVHEGLPKIWLYTDGSGDETATWTVDVTYEGYEDSKGTVYGTISIANTGNIPARIDAVEDDIGIVGVNVTVTCDETLPYTLDLGEILACSYASDEFDALVSGTNTVTVTGKTLYPGDTEFGDIDEEDTAGFEFVTPTTELYSTVNVKDISDLFGEVDLGTVTAPNGDTFTYDKLFAFDGYGAAGCGDYRYDNTASIVETGQTADAALKVNVQCILWESAWAMGTGDGVDVKSFCDSGFSNWGWTNGIDDGYAGSWPLYAGAGQCETSKGTPVGQFELDYSSGSFTYAFVPAPGVLFDDAAVYAGTDMFPKTKRGAYTTAPGQYAIMESLTGYIWVIAHVNAGIPDPDFGPGI